MSKTVTTLCVVICALAVLAVGLFRDARGYQLELFVAHRQLAEAERALHEKDRRALAAESLTDWGIQNLNAVIAAYLGEPRYLATPHRAPPMTKRLGGLNKDLEDLLTLTQEERQELLGPGNELEKRLDDLIELLR